MKTHFQTSIAKLFPAINYYYMSNHNDMNKLSYTILILKEKQIVVTTHVFICTTIQSCSIFQSAKTRLV